MGKLEDKMTEILGVQNLPEKKEEAPVVARVEKDTQIESDHDYSRENYYSLIDRGQKAIDGILEIAQEGQHPRAYEVAGILIKNVGETVDKLQDLQKKLKDLKDVPKTANATIKNALFVGSTTELQKMLKGDKNGKGPKPKE